MSGITWDNEILEPTVCGWRSYIRFLYRCECAHACMSYWKKCRLRWIVIIFRFEYTAHRLVVGVNQKEKKTTLGWLRQSNINGQRSSSKNSYRLVFVFFFVFTLKKPTMERKERKKAQWKYESHHKGKTHQQIVYENYTLEKEKRLLWLSMLMQHLANIHIILWDYA